MPFRNYELENLFKVDCKVNSNKTANVSQILDFITKINDDSKISIKKYIPLIPKKAANHNLKYKEKTDYYIDNLIVYANYLIQSTSVPSSIYVNITYKHKSLYLIKIKLL